MKRASIAVGILAGIGIAAIVVFGIGAIWLVRELGEPRAFGGPIAVRESSALSLRKEDYAKARQIFQTRLLRTGPSPQPVDEAQPLPVGVQSIIYTSGNLQLRAFVDEAPLDGRKRPAVLFLHGGFAYGGDDLEMPQPFRDAGFVVMVPVLRGENGQPGNFTLFYDELNDVLAAAKALADLPYVDARRLFVSGHSAGGTLAMLAAMTFNGFRAAAPISGCCNQLIQDASLTPFDTSNLREFEMRSPEAYATSFRCPVRIYFGDEETWTFASSKTTARRAAQAGLDVEAVVVPGGHMTCVPEGIQKAIAFFDRFGPED